jgi:hypothetical protein
MDTGLIAIGVAIFFGITTLILTMKLRRKKSLYYRVISVTPLLNIEERIKKEIKITYGNEDVKNLHLLLIEIGNNGNEPIQKNEYKKPIIFTFNPKAKILESGVEKLDPKDLQIWFDRKADNIEGITPELLNP